MMQLAVDAQGQIVAWSDAIATVSGFTSDEVLKRHFVEDLLAKEDRECFQEVLEQVCSSKEPVHGVGLTLYSKSAMAIQLVVSISTYSNEETSAAGASITALHAPHRATESDSCGKMQIGLNSEWKITSWGEANEAISGFSSGDVIGRCFLMDIVAYHEREDVLKVLRLVHDYQEFVFNFSFTLYSKSSISSKMSLDISPCIGERGSTVGVLITGVSTPHGGFDVAKTVKVASNILEGAEMHKKRQFGKRWAASSVSMSACTTLDDMPLITATPTASTTMDDLPCFKSTATMEDLPPLGRVDSSVEEL